MPNQTDEDYFNNLQSQVDIIYRCLYLNELNDNITASINSFVDIYLKAYEAHINLDSPDERVSTIYKILDGPISQAYNDYDERLNDGKPHPAVDLIKERVENKSASLEKGFTRVLQKYPGVSLIEDDNYKKAGFVQAFIVLTATVVLGIILGTLLFFIK